MAYLFNEVKLDKGMYSQRGKSFEQVLESLDPNENYKGTAFEGMDAFQRQLKRFDIKAEAQAATPWRSSSPLTSPRCCSPNTSPEA